MKPIPNMEWWKKANKRQAELVLDFSNTKGILSFRLSNEFKTTK